MQADEGLRRGRPAWAPAGSSFWLPLIVAVIQVGITTLAAHGQPERMELDARGVMLLAAGPAALALRRRYPAAVLGFVLATTLAYFLLGYPRGPIFFALIIAVFSAVMAGRRAAAFGSIGAGYVGFLWGGYLVGTSGPPRMEAALGLGAWLLVLITVAEVVRARRERAQEYVRSRAEEAKRRASEERLRIAQELHDVLAHNISLINVQAGVALHLMDQQPGQARTALSAIKQASNDALGELRSVLDILRQGDETSPRAPAARLSHLDDLVRKANASGIVVSARIEGDARPLLAGTDLAAFRIVQEALTNVTRHAGNARATVLVSYGKEVLTVEVEDDGRGADGGSAAGSGNGIAGMRERAAALGGTLEAGPKREGGFRVVAKLPLPASSAEAGAEWS
ncbi:MAG: sensor histidine kinase [Actinomycetota bacterium]|nr:sensor histidine kinase [Actinomycetota bacterium]